MKYLHTGYILLCDQATHGQSGKIDLAGLFDLFVVEQLPSTLKCQIVVGFGTPYERRQYKGYMEIEDPSGSIVLKKEFNANDPEDLYRGHSIIPVELTVRNEGCWSIRVSLYNWKSENVWEVSRQMWAMLAEEQVPSQA